MLAITIDSSQSFLIFFLSFFLHFGIAQETLLIHRMYTGDNFTFSLLLRHDTNTISVLNTSHEALINFSACYFGNFSFLSALWVFLVFFILHSTLYRDGDGFSCARFYFSREYVRTNKSMEEWMILYLLLKDSRDMGWQRKVQSCVLRTNGLRRPM